MTALDDLADRCGIEESFRDARGAVRHTSPETRRALLAAMGIEAEDEAAAQRALADLDRAEWGRPLPPVCVLYRGDGPLAVAVTMPAGCDALRWRLAFEEGGERSGEARFARLELQERRRLDGTERERRLLPLGDGLPLGYHRLTIEPGDGETIVIVTPGTCWLPPAIAEGRRLWGVAAQLYLLRSAGNWGIGDYGDLRLLVEMLAARGADVVGLNPLHAMFLDDPEHASPYSPASRLLLNILNIDIAALPELAHCPEAQALIASEPFRRRLEQCRAASLVEYSEVAALKEQALQLLFACSRSGPGSARWQAFEAFRREQGSVLERGSLFQALRQHFAAQDPGHADWHNWPPAYRDPASDAVSRFARKQAERVTFYAWLQFLADEQLAAAADAAQGMAVGLYRDLAVGADRGGAETWSNQTAVVAEAQVGAPPDIYNPAGQDWDLPPFNPHALRQEAYRSFIDLIRANMRHAGGLRIDHAMALQHLYWIPKGRSPGEGAYVRYPLDDLVGILALESRRHHCLVVGEDLGTVPQGFRERMAAANILSYRVLFFEKDEHGFLPPERYPERALAVAGSHDLPTLRGWWRASDIGLKEELNLFPTPEEAGRARTERERDRTQLVEAFRRAGVIAGDAQIGVAEMMRAAHLYLARSKAALAMAQIDDMTEEADPVNVPATSDEHPNWRRRLSLTLEELSDHPRLEAVVGIFAAERGSRGAAESRIETPRATYRLQFHKDFGFAAAARLAPYLARLGVSHVYASPYLKARPGSTHGYDIIDHDALNPELGDAESFALMCAAFRENGLGQILDFVPNHMGVGGADNPLWLDVLEWGPDSAHAGWFDIDWDPDQRYLHDKLLVPFLGDQYGVVLEQGQLVLKFDAEDGSFAVWAYDSHKLPICPLDYGRILGDAHPELERLGDAFSGLPEWRPQVPRRARELKAELAGLARAKGAVRAAVDAALARFNGEPGRPETWRSLDALIQRQHWRAAHFRVAADDINYRRFFNINDLAGIRMELPEVFDHAHRLVFRLLRDGTLDGLRIDHIDGLLDPKGYLERLCAKAFDGAAPQPFYLAVEKILAPHETLREDWPVAGTTGYEFVNLVLGLLIDPAGEEGFTRFYAEFTGAPADFARIVRDCKIRIMENEMASELNGLARDMARVARQNPRTADFTRNILHRALKEVVASFPVYRTYIDASGAPTAEDRRDLDWALAQARRNETDVDPSVFDFLYKLLSGDLVAEPRSGFSRQAVLRCAMKVQQYSGPVMAKGLEDTAFYRYNRFVALNEVGGHPDQFGTSLAAFHRSNAQRARRWPHAMLGTATHDTKRGEDTRARLAVLSEFPEEWARGVQTWSRILRARAGDVEGTAPPDRNDEYLFFQLLVGTWPVELLGAAPPDAEALKAYAERLKPALVKSLREAKVHSTWAAPNAAYEDAVLGFADLALDPARAGNFLNAFLPFVERLAWLGAQNSLVQTVLKLTLPGLPDLYQGAELWDLSLVDPDNRRPVDYALRTRLLDEVETALAADRGRAMARFMREWQDGRFKLAALLTLLEFRRREPALFAEGGYEPLAAEDDAICAFLRQQGETRIVVAVARFPGRRDLQPFGPDAMLPLPPSVEGVRWRDLLTGPEVPVGGGGLAAATLFADLPAAVLVPASSSAG
ncbi:MAG TPA: malto-oligosyltrehalose synthase [Stellaceae bacterium]|nr:malto-oligosyltrehalose synthase [Stellaceae bacterium]